MAHAPSFPLPYVLSGLATLTSTPMPVTEWAARARIPNRTEPGILLDGPAVQRILGIESKSWDPELFASIDSIAELAQEAVQSADLSPDDIDALITVSCTPYQINFDLDAIMLARRLGLPDAVVPVHLSSGCAGVARALALAARLNAERVLVVTYAVPSLAAGDRSGGINELYRRNDIHPFGLSAWTSPGLFSDGAAAFVLIRGPEVGTVVYSRDCDAFPENPLVHYRGGGLDHSPGTAGAAELSVYGIDGRAVAAYYTQGMNANHGDLAAVAPGYRDHVRRIYTHQAGPALVDAYHTSAGLSEELAPTNVRRYGNLIAAATLRMLHEDLDTGVVKNGDQVCISVVGAGPERGAALLTVDVGSAVQPWYGRSARHADAPAPASPLTAPGP